MGSSNSHFLSLVLSSAKLHVHVSANCRVPLQAPSNYADIRAMPGKLTERALKVAEMQVSHNEIVGMCKYRQLLLEQEYGYGQMVE
jgi:hypothetical protein